MTTNNAHFATTTTTRRENDNGEWRDENGKLIAGAAAANLSATAAAGVAGADVVRVEKVTKVTTVKQVPDDATYTSSASAGRVGSATGGSVHSEATSVSNRNVSGPNRQHDYSPERRREVVSGGYAGSANRGGQDSTTVRQRYTETTQQQQQQRPPQQGGVYQGDTSGPWTEGQENTHGWRAERLSEDQQLEGSGKPMMLDAVAGTRNTRVVQQQPYRVQRVTTTSTLAGQETQDWLKYLLLIPLALLVPLFLASLIGIPLLGALVPWASIFPFLKSVGHFGKHHRSNQMSHSRLHKGYEVKPSSLFEDVTKSQREVFCVPLAWEHLLKSQKWYDVVLVANDGTQVLAHKVVLAARSPVLEKEIDVLIARGKKENKADVAEVCSNAFPCKLTLKNVDGKLLKNFVEFLYSGRVADQTRVEDLLAVGQAFEVIDMHDAAAEELIHGLDANSAGDALILGHDYGHCGLRRAAKAYIRDNWKQVHGNSYFKRAVGRRPSILSDDYIHSDREERTCHLVRQ